MENIKLIALDVDGILTDGSKLYDSSGNSTFKKFNDIDFTAIKVFKALGVEVIFITGDASNSWLAEKRNVKTYVTRLKDGSSISKEKVLNRHLKETGIKHDEVWFAGDDVFDPAANRDKRPPCSLLISFRRAPLAAYLSDTLEGERRVATLRSSSLTSIEDKKVSLKCR